MDTGIQFVRVAAPPPIGSLSSLGDIRALDRQRDINNYLRDHFTSRGAREYFGSKYDRYYDTFQNTIAKHFTNSYSASNTLREALANVSDVDCIRPITTMQGLRRIPPSMYLAILSQPDLYLEFEEGRVHGFGKLTAENVKPYVEMYERIIEKNGYLDMDHDLPKDKNQVITWSWTTDDPELTASEICDLRRTRSFVSYVIKETQLDPTDISDIRG